MATFGEKIRAARDQRGWNQEELGEAIGARQKQVSAWERGKVVPKLPFALAIADRLGLSLNYLMDDSVDVDADAMYTDPERLLVAFCRTRKIDPEAALDALAELDRRLKAHGSDEGIGAEPGTKKEPASAVGIVTNPPGRSKITRRRSGRRSGNSV